MKGKGPASSYLAPIGLCVVCGKQCYSSRKVAKAVRKQAHPDETLTAYKCGSYWHIGHLSDEVKDGKVGRSEYYR